MKIKPLALALTALLLALAPRAARAEDEVSFQFFYDTLSPLGEWVQVGDYGDCWHPTGVDADWAPYTDGYWSYTDAGWTWVSYEDWGGITYHYGRWVRTDEEGWCWVPDYEWGPAWVSWRNNEEAVGWAPLPPEAHWRASVGISTWCDDTYDIGPDYYTFCPIVEFGAPLIRTVCYPRSRNVFFIGNTFNCTNISFNSYHNVVFCGGPNFAFINGHSRHHVPSLKLVFGGDFHHGGHGGHGWTNARNVGNTLQVYAPKIVNNNTTIINKPKITKVINKTQVNKGWSSVKDQGERQKVRAQIKEQNKGLTADNAPARPVKAEDLKGVPEKADVNAPSPVAVNNRRGGKDRNGDGVPDNQKGNIGAGNVPNAGRDRNGDGVPDNQPGRPGNGKGPKVAGKDQNGDGVPDGQQGQGTTGKIPKIVGQDQNGDGIPDNQPGKNGAGNGPNGIGKDRNGDGIPDNQKGNVVPGNGPKPGKDLNGDGIPDRRGSGGFVPPGKNGNGDVDQPGKGNNDLQQQEQAVRRQQMLERQRERQAQIQEQQQQKRQNQEEKRQNQVEQQQKQQNQEELQQRALQLQRNQQVQRQQDMQRQRQEIQRGGQNEIQRQPQVQRERPQPQQQGVPHQAVPQHQPQPQPQPNNGGGGQGKGKNQQQAVDDDGQKKKHN